MTCLHLCLVVIDTLSHLTVYLMYTHVLKIGNDSSALNLLLLPLSTLPRYVVLRSEFSSNLVALTVSNWIPSYTSRYSSHNLSVVLPKSNSLNTFSPSVSGLCLYLFTALCLVFVSLCKIYHVVYNLKHCSKLTIVPFVSS